MGCSDLEWRATTLAEKVTRCEHDYDCCFVWDVLSDCTPANRSDEVAADLAELQDTTLRLVRECQKKGQGCDARIPICRHGHCTGTMGKDQGCTLFGYRYGCPQPYHPAVREVRADDPGVVLLTDPKRDSRFAVPAPDRGQDPYLVVEVCVSEQGDVTSARNILGRMLGRTTAFTIAVEEKIIATWKYKPLFVASKAVPFCTNVPFSDR